MELDFTCYEQVTNVWVRLVDKMSVDGNRNLNQSLKELSGDYGSSDLSIFKWMDFLMKLDKSSPVFSVALVQYWRLTKQCEGISTHNVKLLDNLRTKLLAPDPDASGSFSAAVSK